MKMGHEFGAEHGFSGSTMPTKEMRPSVPGFKRGGHIPHAQHTIMPDTSNDDEFSAPNMPMPSNMKHGGLAHIKGHHKNYAHGGKIEHDDHPKHGSIKYDKDGYASHKHGRME